MADWSGRIADTANARGVWMRSSSLIEHIPSFPGVITDSGTDVAEPSIDEVLATSEADFPHAECAETEITDTTASPISNVPNRDPITDPPVPRRTYAPPRPERLRLIDEGPDPAESTPPTWDMGLLPATYADAEITENATNDDPAPSPSVDIELDDAMHAATLQADQEASVTLDMELLSPGERDALGFDTPQQELREVPSLKNRRRPSEPGLPMPAPVPTPRPLKSHMRASPGPRVPSRNRSSATSATGAPKRVRKPDPAARPMRDDFASQAPTRPRVPVQLRSVPVSIDEHVLEGPSLFERAGWWTAGALAGMIGASVLSSMALAIVFLI